MLVRVLFELSFSPFKYFPRSRPASPFFSRPLPSLFAPLLSLGPLSLIRVLRDCSISVTSCLQYIYTGLVIFLSRSFRTRICNFCNFAKGEIVQQFCFISRSGTAKPVQVHEINDFENVVFKFVQTLFDKFGKMFKIR